MKLDTEKDFHEAFPDNNSAIEFMMSIRWPNGIVCPKCGCAKIYILKEVSMNNGQKFLCSRQIRIKDNKQTYAHRGRFTVLTNTLFDSSNISAHKLLLLLYCVAYDTGHSTFIMAKKIGCTQITSWRHISRLKKIVINNNSDSLYERFIYLLTHVLTTFKKRKKNGNKTNIPDSVC